jgi:beta-glucanase (GH16 family)
MDTKDSIVVYLAPSLTPSQKQVQPTQWLQRISLVAAGMCFGIWSGLHIASWYNSHNAAIDPCASAPITIPGATLLWSDEFYNADTSLPQWSFEYGNNNGWGNNELEYYTNTNVWFDNCQLVITAKKEEINGFHYSSSRITTIPAWKPAGDRAIRIEARMKLPDGGNGIWPAFWLMPRDDVYGGWPSSGEIDVLEAVVDMSTIYGSVHYGGQGKHEFTIQKKQGVSTGEFHVFAVEWTFNSIKYFVDDQFYHEVTADTWWTANEAGAGMNDASPFDQDFQVKLNLAVGGNWPGYPDDNTAFPQSLTVDYVRVLSVPI